MRNANPTQTTCPECGASISASTELCPACLLLGGLEDELTLRDATSLNAHSDLAGPTLPAHLRYFGDYELLEEIGRGAMGAVYRARQTSLGRTVAVKLLLGGAWASKEARRRFHDEARAAAGLRHPGIVTIHEVGELEDQPYFSMDLVEGVSLSTRLRQKPVGIRQAAEWLTILARTVEVAHRQGILHRDLKPSNILIDGDGQPVITDFGLAKDLGPTREGRRGDTLTGQILGTPGYIPPERLASVRREEGPEGDIYALGAVLFTLLSGRPPFVGSTPFEVMVQATHGVPPRPRELSPGVPRDLEAICLRCLEREPAARYSSAGDLADDLDRFLAGEAVTARPLSPWRSLGRRLGRHRWALAALVGAALLVTAGLEFWPRRQPSLLVESATLRLEAGDRRGALDLLSGATPSAEARSAAMRAWMLPDIRRQLELPVHPVDAVAWSHDGARLGLLSRIESKAKPPKAAVLTVIDAVSGKTLELAKGRLDGAWLEHPRWPAVAVDQNRIKIFDPRSGGLIEIPVDTRQLAVAESEWTFFPDGRVAFTDSEGRLRVWNGQGRQADFLPSRGSALAFLPPAELLFLDGGLFARDLIRGTLRSAAPMDEVVAISADGGTAVLGGPSTTVWDLRQNRRIVRFGLTATAGQTIRSGQALLSDDGRWLAIHGDRYQSDLIRIWELARPDSQSRLLRLEAEKGAPVLPRRWAFSPDGQLLAIQMLRLEQPWVGVWSLATGRLVAELSAQTAPFAWHPESRTLVTGGDLGQGRRANRRGLRTPVGAVLWHFDGLPAGFQSTFEPAPPNWPPPVQRLVWLAGGQRLASDEALWQVTLSPPRLTRDDARVGSSPRRDPAGGLWSARFPGDRPAPRRPLELRKVLPESWLVTVERPSYPELEDDGRRIVARAIDYALSDSSTLWMLCRLERPSAEGQVEELTTALEVWDLPVGRRRRIVTLEDEMRLLEVSSDAMMLAVGSASGIALWNTVTLEPLRVLPHDAPPAAIAFSPLGHAIASGSAAGEIHLSRIAADPDGSPRTVSWPARQGAIQSLAFDAAEGLLASGSANGEIALWRLAPEGDGPAVEWLRWRAHDNGVGALAFHPLGPLLVSGGGRGELRLWDVEEMRRRLLELGLELEEVSP